MARRRTSTGTPGTGSVRQLPSPDNPFPNIEWFIENGEITLGDMYPVGSVATASDSHQTPAMLKRRPGETFMQLLQRLDDAIAAFWETDATVDEINPPRSK